MTWDLRSRKLKWDGRVSNERPARLIRVGAGRIVWETREGSGAVVRSCARAGHWWFVTFGAFGAADPAEVAIDICMPVRLDGAVLSFIDLDLDFVGHLADPLRLTDCEDFEERSVSMGYPAWLKAGAWRGVEDARRHVANRWWPFGR
jgi:protein associated with RNAse G/E